MTTETKKFKIMPRDFTLAAYNRNEYVVYVDGDVAPEDLLSPDAWEHIAADLNPWDTIEVRWDDMSKKAMLTVVDSSRIHAVVRIDYQCDFSDYNGDSGLDDLPFFVKYRGKAKWSVIRRSDDTVVSQGHTSRKIAEKEMLNMLKDAA